MRRYWAVILFLIVLVVPFVLRWAVATPQASTPQKSKQANSSETLPLLVITPHGEGIRREFHDAFSKWHLEHYGKPVDITYLLYGGTGDILKYFEASKATFQQLGTFNVDIAFGGGDFFFDQQLKKAGCLEALNIDPAKPDLDPAILAKAFPKHDLGGLPLMDADAHPSWFGVVLAGFGICYNKDVVRYLGVPEPKTWRDLADPRYERWLIMADPTRSTSAKAAFLAVVERSMADASAQGRSEDDGWADGMGLLRLIAANTRAFTDGSGVVPNLICSGDVAAGMTIDFYARSQIDAVGASRMGYVEPVNATIINPDPVALIKGAPHRETAVHFIEFLLSEDGQRIWKQKPGTPGGPLKTALWRQPVMPDVYNLPADTLTDPINPYHGTASFNKSNAREKTFGIVGELLEFSCMDVLDELRETRDVIRAHHRDDLEQKLGKFPFDQKEALARGKQWSDATPIQRLDLKRKWTQEFRDEYRALRETAER